MNVNTPRHVFAIVEDFFFIPQIERAIKDIEYSISFLEEKADFSNFDIFKKVEGEKPNLIIIDMNYRSMDWEDLLKTLKLNDASKDIPILIFGAHTNVDAFKLAKSLGADQVIGKSQFVKNMGKIISKITEGNR